MNGDPQNHHLCAACWREREGSREPHRLEGAERDKCCGCGRDCQTGIFVRGEARFFRNCPVLRNGVHRGAQ